MEVVCPYGDHLLSFFFCKLFLMRVIGRLLLGKIFSSSGRTFLYSIVAENALCGPTTGPLNVIPSQLSSEMLSCLQLYRQH